MFSSSICAYANKLKQNVSILTWNPSEPSTSLDKNVSAENIPLTGIYWGHKNLEDSGWAKIY